ncbi:MAG: HPr family phosphocarrier protein [Spirochaeta sp.]|nr:HPr family phosphocarrier protein [Spirochaeta sp.]
MPEISVQIINETGLHSRPADLFVRTAKLYQSEILVFHGERSASAKNIIKVILLNAAQGETIRIVATGSDANEAIADLQRLVESGFQEINTAVEV